MDELRTSLSKYNTQLFMVTEALAAAKSDSEREPLVALKCELTELIQLTQESINALILKENDNTEISESGPSNHQQNNGTEMDDEYNLFMQEMANSGAYEADNDTVNPETSNNNLQQVGEDSNSDIEDELATLLGMKCAVYHTHKWGGQPSLHNAMVSAVVPRQEDDEFKDLQVQVLFTHPTHAEMLPCPFFLDGECKFDDEHCRYSHGTIIPLSSLKEAIEPNFETVKAGSRVLLKLKPPDNEDINLARKSTEKYFLWHRAIVTHVDFEKEVCIVKYEHGLYSGEKRKVGSGSEEYTVKFEEIFPLNTDNDKDSDSDSLSDTEYPENKCTRSEVDTTTPELLIEKSLQYSGPAMGQWERHTRGIGSKLMLAMGYVPGTGLGVAGEGRVQPVEARVLPVGKSLDHCMAITEKANAQDPYKVEQKLRRLQKKEEDRNKRAYKREKEKERRNVFNFLNRTLGDGAELESTVGPLVDIKQSTSKDLNIEQFKITEDTKRLEREVLKLNSSLTRQPVGSPSYKNISLQISEKHRELDLLRKKEKQIAKEQSNRKDKKKMIVF